MSMRILVTGANGFVGQHLLAELQNAGHEVCALVEKPGQEPTGIPARAVDIRHPRELRGIIRALAPEACIHLAGIAFVPLCWKDPKLAVDVNLGGVINLLEALRDVNSKTRTLIVTSSEVYGREGRGHAITEDEPLRPTSLYGVTKAAADEAARVYARHHHMPVMCARPQNHIGVGQSEQFVVSSFARKLISRARDPHAPAPMRTGNLDTRRDFTDVRDVARAYRLLIEQGQGGEAYNIASEKEVPIRQILEALMAITGVSPELDTDPELFRPCDNPPLLSTRKLREATTWAPEIPLEESLQAIYKSMLKDHA